MTEIKFDKRNYRIHNDSNKKLIRKSLEECGEIWVDVKGYEGLYKVSNKGRIKSLARGYKNQYGEFGAKKEFIKIQKLNCFNKENKQERGYYVVNLARDDRGKWVRVHKLVAEAFIPNEKNLPEVNHKDENPSNNRVENLEWCDRKYNVNYGTLKERMRARMIANNPFKGRTHTLETKKKISDKKTGQPSKRKRVVVIHGQKYGSVTMAMKVLGLSTRALYKLIKE